MSLIWSERLVDLGAQGMLALTVEAGVPVPLPAHRHAHARWHDAAGAVHDRLAACTRAPGAAALQAAVQQQRARLGGAVPSVRGRIDWVAAQVDETYREAPTAVAPLAGAQVLLMFCGVVAPRCLRVVDLACGRVLGEETVEALCDRLGVQPLFPGHAIDPVLFAAGGGRVALWLGPGLRVLQAVDGRLQATALALPRNTDRLALTPTPCFLKTWDSAELQVSTFDGSAPMAVVTSPHARKGFTDVQGATHADRAVLAHPGGTVEAFDAEGRSLGAWRPFPSMGRQEQLGAQLSACGRFALCGSEAWQVLDLQQGRQAELMPLPYPDGGDRLGPFDATVCWRGMALPGEHGLWRLLEGRLSLEPWDGLPWQPAQAAGARRRSVATAARDAARHALLHRPGHALVPGDGAIGHLYGRPRLAAAAWPRHEGRPMLPLCEVDLAAAALPGWPQAGLLQCFVAADAAGEPLVDERFNPVAWQVRLEAAATAGASADACAAPPDAPPLPDERPLALAPTPAVWPQPDAPAVRAYAQTQGWTARQIESYRRFVDAGQPDGAGPGHRLGGCPTVLQHNDLELDAVQAAGGELSDAPRWRLLLQLDSDERFMWGTDSGLLYFMVDGADLARGDFARVVALTHGA